MTELTRPPARSVGVQERARATRLRVLLQAEIAFAEMGYGATSLTSDILEPAGVSVGSFYHQFENKREVLFELIAWRTEERKRSILDRIALLNHDIEATLRALFGALFDDIRDRPAVWTLQVRAMMSPDPAVRTFARVGVADWEEFIAGVVARSTGASKRDVLGATRIVLMGFTGVIMQFMHLSSDEQGMFRDRYLDSIAVFSVGGVERVLDFNQPLADLIA